MLVIATFTLWILFSMWLVFPHLAMPRMLCLTAGALMWAEFIALIGYGLASEDCTQRPCSVMSETLRDAAGLDLPALTVFVFILAGAVIAREHRRAGRPRRDVAGRA